jgi:hypothetical protein
MTRVEDLRAELAATATYLRETGRLMQAHREQRRPAHTRGGAMSLERLTAIERKLAVIKVLVVVTLVLTMGVFWLNCTILGRLPR